MGDSEVFKNQSLKSQLFSSSQKKIPQIEIMACVCLRADHCVGGGLLDSSDDRMELVTFNRHSY